MGEGWGRGVVYQCQINQGGLGEGAGKAGMREGAGIIFTARKEKPGGFKRGWGGAGRGLGG